MLLSDGLFFGGGYLRSLHELEEDQQGPSYVYYAKIYLIQIPQKNIAERKSSWVPGRGLFSKQRLKNTAFNTDIHLKPCRMSVHPSGIVPFHSGLVASFHWNVCGGVCHHWNISQSRVNMKKTNLKPPPTKPFHLDKDLSVTLRRLSFWPSAISHHNG